MKKLFLILLCLPCFAIAQDSVRVVAIKAEPYSYPVIQYKNKQVEDKINKRIIALFLDSTSFTIKHMKDSIDFAAKRMKQDGYDWNNHYYMGGLISLDYSKSYNRNGFLSISLYGEYLGAYISGDDEDAVFDLKTGKLLLLEDLLDKNFGAFRDTVFKDMRETLDTYYKPDSTNYDSDCTSEYVRMKDELYNGIDTMQAHFYVGKNFIITDYGISFSYDIYRFPHYMQVCDIYFQESFSWKQLEQFVSPKSVLYSLVVKGTKK